MKRTVLLSALLAASVMILCACSSSQSTGQTSEGIRGGHSPGSVLGSR